MRFYGLDPEKILTMPPLILSALASQRERLQTEEMLTAAIIAGVPHMERRARARLLNRWERAVEPPAFLGETETQYSGVAPEDMEAARAWWEAQGVRVETKGANNDG